MPLFWSLKCQEKIDFFLCTFKRKKVVCTLWKMWMFREWTSEQWKPVQRQSAVSTATSGAVTATFFKYRNTSRARRLCTSLQSGATDALAFFPVHRAAAWPRHRQRCHTAALVSTSSSSLENGPRRLDRWTNTARIYSAVHVRYVYVFGQIQP